MANESELETDKNIKAVSKKVKKAKKAKKKKKKAAKDEKSIDPSSLDGISLHQSKTDQEVGNVLKPNNALKSEEERADDQKVGEMTTCEENNEEIATSTSNEEIFEYVEDRKFFLTRIPSNFGQDAIRRILQESFGENTVEQISLVGTREDEVEKEGRGRPTTEGNEKDEKTHRGFAFVVMSTIAGCKEAIEKGTIKGSEKENSKKKHTMYMRPIVRNDEVDSTTRDETCLNQKDICYLWAKFRCPYGTECKFRHDGEGGCLEKTDAKKKKCFSFRTTGKCKRGDDCPYSHDIKCTKVKVVREAKDKHCIDWKTKGKCRKGDKCPYRHDDAVREAFVKKKMEKKTESRKKKRERSENPQPLSVRVFGLNYDTTEEDVREYFRDCGPISEIMFPVFEDSGRSKGYCGVLFTSPKATEKACELDGQELHGRWLSVQPGKMYLKQWAEREKTRLEETQTEPEVGEFGQKVKKRKRHGFKDMQ